MVTHCIYKYGYEDRQKPKTTKHKPKPTLQDASPRRKPSKTQTQAQISKNAQLPATQCLNVVRPCRPACGHELKSQKMDARCDSKSYAAIRQTMLRNTRIACTHSMCTLVTNDNSSSKYVGMIQEESTQVLEGMATMQHRDRFSDSDDSDE